MATVEKFTVISQRNGQEVAKCSFFAGDLSGKWLDLFSKKGITPFIAGAISALKKAQSKDPDAKLEIYFSDDYCALRSEPSEIRALIEERANLPAEVAHNPEITVTPKEQQALKGIRDSQYHSRTDIVGEYVWSWSANTFATPAIFSGVVASLKRKGLVEVRHEDGENLVALTQVGFETLRRIA